MVSFKSGFDAKGGKIICFTKSEKLENSQKINVNFKNFFSY